MSRWRGGSCLARSCARYFERRGKRRGRFGGGFLVGAGLSVGAGLGLGRVWVELGGSVRLGGNTNGGQPVGSAVGITVGIVGKSGLVAVAVG